MFIFIHYTQKNNAGVFLRFAFCCCVFVELGSFSCKSRV